jgi:hypothetical protein
MTKESPKFSSAKAALAKALLDGRVLNVGNCFHTIGLTNCSREVSRMIEEDFDVRVERFPRKGTSRYGTALSWYDFKLDKSLPENKEGVAKMRNYVAEHMIEYRPKPKINTVPPKEMFTQPKLF